MAGRTKVSIISPCYKAERYIGATIESVRRQTLADWEHIVVDDGSPDGGAEIVAAAAQEEPRLQLIRQSNRGVSAARNTGFRAATPESEYLVFLDADDCLVPTMLERVAGYMDAHPTVAMVHCGHRYINDSGELLPQRDTHILGLPRYVPRGLRVGKLTPDCVETPFVSIYTNAGIVPSICMLRRSVYEATPGWDEAFGQHHEDTDLFLQIALHGAVHFFPEELVWYRRHTGQHTYDMSRFGRQQEKLYEKWDRLVPTLEPEQRRTVEDARRFLQGRVIPWKGWKGGIRHLRRGEIATALRFWGGAGRRYLRSFLPSSQPVRRASKKGAASGAPTARV
jgi:GT2 family glycosyltransferase